MAENWKGHQSHREPRLAMGCERHPSPSRGQLHDGVDGEPASQASEAIRVRMRNV